MTRFHARARAALTLLTVLATLLPAGCSTVPPASKDTVAQLHSLFESEWQRGLREDPLGASGLGDTRYNDQLPDLSLAAIAHHHEEDLAALAQLNALERGTLPPDEALNAQLFREQLQDGLDAYGFRAYLMPLDHIYGLQSSQGIIEVLQFNGEKDYRDWIARLRAFGVYTDQTIALLREGAKQGLTPACSILHKVPPQIDAQLVAKPQESAFYAPFQQLPDSLPQAARDQLAKDGADAIAGTVLPAFQRFKAFFNDDYLPHCRIADGVSTLPNGAAYYTYLARHHTTTTLTPDQIYQIGLREVARIGQRMSGLRAQIGFKGDAQAFANFLRTDPQFYFKTGDELFAAYAVLAKKIDGELPLLFDKLPRLPYGVRAVPMDTAAYQTTAYYQPGAADGTRAGFFYTNLYKPETRPRWEMEVLTSHEAVPGHHLQISLGQELADLPQFRRNAGYTAFVEGWALYSEGLGYELGLYKDPYSQYGQLTYEMWRACRLVVDTGIHAKGWTRQQAIDYMIANMPRARNDIEVEVDRYIAWPGQALAYKIGQMKILELRQRAEARLGTRFDVRQFHDVVLGSGALPLDVLERNVDEWIVRR